MPITSVSSDAEALTLTVVGDYTVPVDRLWQAFADPRQLERFWGPVEWPATFTRHDMEVGGYSQYHMTGPDGSTSHGSWHFLAIDEGRRFEVEDGFTDDNGMPNDGLPKMRMIFTFASTAQGSRFTGVTHFPSLEEMQQMLEMGMLEGMQSAMGQLDALLAEPAPV